jgi:beta-aspartyl-peptidase (threonine type)
VSCIVVSSKNGSVGIRQAIDILRNGGSALDAVVAATELVEANPDDHSVGYSGLPNLIGEVELDASVMDGRGLRAGSVGALKTHQDAVRAARGVMESLPHVLIVGAGADRFAAESGLPATQLLTPEAERTWRERLDHEPRDHAYMSRVREIAGALASDPEFPEPPHGTVNFIARDRTGNIACAVSTSGWAWKYPGRLGDSPIIGAGNYTDNRWGAAACTGRGEMALRCLTAHSVVMFMRFGMSLEDALRTAMTDLHALDDPYASEMNIVAIDCEGNPGAASTAAGKTYLYMRDDMPDFVEAERIQVPLP